MTVEATVVAYLSGFAEIPVSTNVPTPRPPRFITVERTGGGKGRFQDFPTVAVQCWAESRYYAETLADEVAELLRVMRAAVPDAKRVDVGGVYNFPDPDSEHARFQVVVSIWLHH